MPYLHRWNRRVFNTQKNNRSKEALAGLSVLDLLVKSADNPERLDALLEQLGKGLRVKSIFRQI